MKFLEVRNVCDSVLSLQTGLVHLTNSFAGVGTLGSLSRQHHTVSTIGNSVSDVTDFGTGWAGVVDHGFEHLGSANDGLACDVAHGYHLFLGSKYLSGRNLNTQITSSNHDTIGFLQNLLEVVDALSVLDLGYDLDVLAVLTKDLTDGLDILSTADEGSKDHVNIILDTKSEIVLIFFGQGGQIDVGVGEVDTLLGRNLAIVTRSDTDGLIINNLENVKCKDTIVDVDDTSRLDDLGDVLIINIPGLGKVNLGANGNLGASKAATYIFLASEAVAYLSSVVMFISVPADIGRSSSPGVLPVLISGPLVSSAMAI